MSYEYLTFGRMTLVSLCTEWGCSLEKSLHSFKTIQGGKLRLGRHKKSQSSGSATLNFQRNLPVAARGKKGTAAALAVCLDLRPSTFCNGHSCFSCLRLCEVLVFLFWKLVFKIVVVVVKRGKWTKGILTSFLLAVGTSVLQYCVVPYFTENCGTVQIGWRVNRIVSGSDICKPVF